DGTYSVDSLSTIDIKALCGFSRFAKPAAVRSALIKLPTFSGNCACTPEKVILQTKTVIREYLLIRFITFFDICPLQSNLIPKRAHYAICLLDTYSMWSSTYTIRGRLILVFLGIITQRDNNLHQGIPIICITCPRSVSQTLYRLHSRLHKLL